MIAAAIKKLEAKITNFEEELRIAKAELKHKQKTSKTGGPWF